MKTNHNNTGNEQQSSTFWKKICKPLPGRAIVSKEVRSSSEQNSSSASFEDFEENLRSAWYAGFDEYFSTSNESSSNRLGCSPASGVRKNYPINTFVRRNIQTQSSHESSEERSHEVDSSSNPLNKTHHSEVKQHAASGANVDATISRVAKFRSLLNSPLLKLDELRCLSWSGIPDEVRPTTWKLLAGYLPLNLERRQTVIEQKRLEYWNLVTQYFDKDRDDENDKTYRQIHIDIPRMSPLIALFQQKTVQEMFERILYIWAIRHPASGYVQGINDLVTPFYVVFLQDYLPPGKDLDTIEVDTFPEYHRNKVEADSFWCFSKFLNVIQDNYIFAQIGIQSNVKQLKELIQRVDGDLHKQLQKHEIDYIQFSFRWMNNMLMREIPLRCSVRLWDTYLAESDGFASFHLYVCAAFLLHWRQQLLLEREFQGLMIMLQNLPTRKWTDSDINVLVAKAFILKFSFADAPNHLQRD